MEKICGVIEDALTKNNWAKLILSSKNFPSHIRKNAVIVGTCFSNPEKGQKLEIEGDWDKHERWGWQFKASTSHIIKEELPEVEENSESSDESEKVLCGTIKRAMVKESGWARLSLEFDKIPAYVVPDEDTIIVIGMCFLDVEVGRRLRIEGKWNNDPQWGWQFKAISAKVIEPTSLEEMTKLLSGDLLKSVGPAIAKKFVDHFGMETMKIIENHPERLAEVKGIGQKKIAQITKSYQDKKDTMPLRTFLSKCSVSDQKIKKIYKQYGDDAEKIINTNPYRLCDDISGFGFKIADGIAKAANIVGNNPFRLKAAVSYVLKQQAAMKGHLFLKQSELAPLVREALDKSFENGEISDMDIINAENDGIDNKIYTRIGSNLYLTKYYKAESYVAKKIRNLSSKQSPELKEPYNVIRDLENKFNIKYAPKQIEAILAALSSQLLVITGGPGTGKTTIIRGIITAYKKLYPKHVIDICAPTGRAALKITETSGFEAKTIHRLIEIGGGSNNKEDKDDDDTNIYYVGKNEENPLKSDLIIIDESSMIDMMLMCYFMKAVKNGCKLVFVGDADQLPSVGAGNVFSDMVKSKRVQTVLLNEIFRQKDTSRIIINAHKINKGEYPLDWGSDFEFIDEDNEDMAAKIIGRYVTDIIRDSGGNLEAVQVLSPLRKRTATGVNELNLYLQSLINPETVTNRLSIKHLNTVFRTGDKVIQMKNIAKRDVYNGDIGFIKKMYKNEIGEIEAVIDFGNREKIYTKDDFDDVDLSYATTVHKSQGSEFPIIIMPISKSHTYSLQKNILYTAVTRAKAKVILVGSKRNFIIGMKKNDAAERNTNLLKEIDKDL